MNKVKNKILYIILGIVLFAASLLITRYVVFHNRQDIQNDVSKQMERQEKIMNKKIEEEKLKKKPDKLIQLAQKMESIIHDEQSLVKLVDSTEYAEMLEEVEAYNIELPYTVNLSAGYTNQNGICKLYSLPERGYLLYLGDSESGIRNGFGYLFGTNINWNDEININLYHSFGKWVNDYPEGIFSQDIIYSDNKFDTNEVFEGGTVTDGLWNGESDIWFVNSSEQYKANFDKGIISTIKTKQIDGAEKYVCAESRVNSLVLAENELNNTFGILGFSDDLTIGKYTCISLGKIQVFANDVPIVDQPLSTNTVKTADNNGVYDFYAIIEDNTNNIRTAWMQIAYNQWIEYDFENKVKIIEIGQFD